MDARGIWFECTLTKISWFRAQARPPPSSCHFRSWQQHPVPWDLQDDKSNNGLCVEAGWFCHSRDMPSILAASYQIRNPPRCVLQNNILTATAAKKGSCRQGTSCACASFSAASNSWARWCAASNCRACGAKNL